MSLLKPCVFLCVSVHRLCVFFVVCNTHVLLLSVCVCLCNVQKFVSTSLRPTPPESSQLYTWQGCAAFVANFLSLEPIDPPTEPVRRHITPHVHVVKCQRIMFVFTSFSLTQLMMQLDTQR